ncbi:MAG TPA: phosphoglucosamine mutase [Nevskiales bacterium]|nr:phosphoglucosamine mutase [Nevskiales bacterium]
MARKYFGTDGVRGRVGESPMTPDFALKLGWAAGRILAPQGRARVVIGKDTRLSGYMFESALEAGFNAAGVNVLLLGPMPTPAIAYLTRSFMAQAGVVISASHNPFHDNGVKFFSAQGHKLPDAVELQIERLLEAPLQVAPSAELGKTRRAVDADGRYVEFCKASLGPVSSLKGLRVVLDCAHGAAYKVAPLVFSELGAQLSVIGNQPDGLNINRDCGSTHPQALQQAVRAQGADVGIALDGDGDRCILVDRHGAIVDGDQILYIIARARQQTGGLRGPVVGTLMSNLGLEQALAALGIGFERAKVGDRYVLERLLETGGNLGGESSGHILCLDRTTTGDGIVSALQVLGVMAASGQALDELLAGMHKCPQTLINVPVRAAAAELLAHAQVRATVAAVEKRLGREGRVLLRPSGTEPLIRVMVEGVDAALVAACAEEIATSVRTAA